MTAYYEFGGIAFGPRLSDQQPLVNPGESFFSLRHIPYSDYNVLDTGGIGPSTYASQIRVAPSNAASFVALLQERATLVVAGVNKGPATLTRLTQMTADPVQMKWRWFQAEWVLG